MNKITMIFGLVFTIALIFTIYMTYAILNVQNNSIKIIEAMTVFATNMPENVTSEESPIYHSTTNNDFTNIQTNLAAGWVAVMGFMN